MQRTALEQEVGAPQLELPFRLEQGLDDLVSNWIDLAQVNEPSPTSSAASWRAL